jgi:predicted NBD/HSP70 family sugar kinase
MSSEPARPTLRGRSFAETRSAVLDLIRSSGEITRVELSRRAGLTEATISKVVNDLLGSGVVVASGRAQSTGGKPATLLRLSTSELWSIGIVLDLPQIALVLSSLDGTLVESCEITATREDEPDVVLERIVEAIRALLQGHATTRESVIGIGVALPGRRDYQGPNPLDWWEQISVQDRLEQLLGVEVLLENDANCAALHEFWSGGFAAGHDFALVYAADGVGAGIIVDGDVYRGVSGQAGEIGHVFVDGDGTPCWCGRRGCLEVTGTPIAVAHRVRDEEPELMAELGLPADASLRAIFAAVAERAASGAGGRAAEIIAGAAERVATAIVGMVNTLDLDLVVLAGPGFAEAGEIYAEAVRAALDTTYVRSLHAVEVRLRAVGVDASALGAASLVLHRQLTPHHAA